MSIHLFLSTNFATRLGWTLVHSIWEGAAVAALLALALAVLRRLGPQARYLASSAALALLLLGVAVTFYYASVPMPVPSHDVRTQIRMDSDQSVRVKGSSIATIVEPVAPPVNSSASASEFGHVEIPVVPPTHKMSPASVRLGVRVARFTPWVSGAWAIGVLVLSIWHLGGWIAAQRLRVLGVRPAGARVTGLTGKLAHRLNLSRTPLVLQSLLTETPIVIGWIRPVILLPVAVMTGLTPQQLEAVLAHELAHIRRHDYLVNLLQVAAETLLFYHPAVWFISRRMRLEREQCCDDVALSVCTDRCAYAGSLAALEEVRLGRTMALAARGSGGAQLLARVRRLLGQSDDAPHRVAGAATAAVILALTALVMAGVWMHSPTARAGDPKDSTNATPAPGGIGKQMFRVQTNVRVTKVAFSPDGNLLALGGAEAMANILDAKTGNTVATLKLLRKVDQAALTKRGWSPAAVEVHALAFSPDSSVLAVYTNIGQVKLFDVRTGALLLSLNDAKVDKSELSAKFSQGDIFSIAFSPDGSMLATCGEPMNSLTPGPELEGLAILSMQLKLWNTKTGALIHDLMIRDELGYDVAFSPDGRFLASTGMWQPAADEYVFGVKLWNPQTGKMVRAIPVPDNGRANSIAFSPDGKRMAIGTIHYNKATDVTSGTIHVASPVSDKTDPEWMAPIPAWQEPLSPDGNPFAAFQHYKPHPWMARVAFSPDGSMIAARSAINEVTLWDAQTGKPRIAIPAANQGHASENDCFAFSPKTNVLAIGGIDDKKRGFVEVRQLNELPAKSSATRDEPAGLAAAIERLAPQWGAATDGLRCRWIQPEGPFTVGTRPKVMVEIENATDKQILWECQSKSTWLVSVTGVDPADSMTMPEFTVSTDEKARPATEGEIRAKFGVGPQIPHGDAAPMPGYYALSPGGKIRLHCSLPEDPKLFKAGDYQVNTDVARLNLRTNVDYPREKGIFSCSPMIISFVVNDPQGAPAQVVVPDAKLDRASLIGLWVHQRNDKPGPSEPTYYLLELGADGRWVNAALWGTPQKPEKAVVYGRGIGFELAPLEADQLKAYSGQEHWLSKPEYSLNLPQGSGSSLNLGQLARKDADTIVFHRFESIHWANEYVRAAPRLQESLQGLLEAASSPATQPVHAATESDPAMEQALLQQLLDAYKDKLVDGHPVVLRLRDRIAVLAEQRTALRANPPQPLRPDPRAVDLRKIERGDALTVAVLDLIPGDWCVRAVRVDQRGKVNLPLMSNFDVAGRTLPEAELALAKAYADPGIVKRATVVARFGIGTAAIELAGRFPPDGGGDKYARERFVKVERFARLPMDQQAAGFDRFYYNVVSSPVKPVATMLFSRIPDDIFNGDGPAQLHGDPAARWLKQLHDAESTLTPEQVAEKLNYTTAGAAAHVRTLEVLRNHPDALAKLLNNDLAAPDENRMELTCDVIATLRLTGYTAKLLPLCSHPNTLISDPATSAILWMSDQAADPGNAPGSPPKKDGELNDPKVKEGALRAQRPLVPAVTQVELEARTALVEVEKFARLPMDQQAAGFAHFYRDIAPRSVSPMAVMVLSSYPENIFEEKTSAPPGGDYESRWVTQLQEKASTLTPEQVAEKLPFVMVRAAAHVRTLDVLRKHPEALAKLLNEDLDSRKLPDVKRATGVIGTLKLPGFTDKLLALFFADTPLSEPAKSALIWLTDPAMLRSLLDQIAKDPRSLIRCAGLFQGPLAGRPAEPALVKLLDSPDPDIRNAAAYALYECVDPRLAAPIAKLADDSDPRLNDAALQMALRLPDDAFKSIRADLVPLLRSSTHDVEYSAIRCFAKHKDLAAGPVIWSKLQLDTIDPGDAVTIMQAMDALAGSSLGYDLHHWGLGHNQEAIQRFETVLRNAGVQIGEKGGVRGGGANAGPGAANAEQLAGTVTDDHLAFRSGKIEIKPGEKKTLDIILQPGITFRAVIPEYIKDYVPLNQFV